MRVLLGVVAVLILLALGGLAALYAGVYDVAASSPHQPAVRWLLDTALRQSVRAQARDVSVPSLGEPMLVEEGARHFQAHCVLCHGAPGVEPAPFARHMRPQPPRLSDAVAHWTSAELFWIVRHGLKLTGMPAWGAIHTENEIWAVVAFLGQMPTMDADRYRQIVTPTEPPAPQPGAPGAEGMIPPESGEEPPPAAPDAPAEAPAQE